MAAAMASRVSLGLLMLSFSAPAQAAKSCSAAGTCSIHSGSNGTTPYKGDPEPIPGYIQGEEYDNGGLDVAYHDATYSQTGTSVFRADQSVDIDDLVGEQGYAVSNTVCGEYLKFTVDVTKDVEAFDFKFRVSAPAGADGSFRIVSGGTGCLDYETDLSGLVKVTSTGGFRTYEEQLISGPSGGGLNEGTAVLSLCVAKGGFNIDAFHVLEAPTVLDGASYNGVSATIPGRIQAEEYDNGGQGVAYFDTTPGNNWDDFREYESVDVYEKHGEYLIGKITDGEHMRYTVDVSMDVDAFYFIFRVSSGHGAKDSFSVVSGGTGCDDYTVDLSGKVTVPSTGSYAKLQNLTIVGKNTGGLTAGSHYIWLCVWDAGMDIDYFDMLRV